MKWVPDKMLETKGVISREEVNKLVTRIKM